MNIAIKSLPILIAVALFGCGGNDEMDAIRAGTVGSPIPSKPSNTVKPEKPEKPENTNKCYQPNFLSTNGVRVIDGDTVEVIPLSGGKSERVRLLGIDAPESAQEYGSQSTEALAQCVADSIVTIEWTERDRYDRLLGKVIANNVDCNLNQVEQGAAWHYKEYQSGQTPFDQVRYANAETTARLGGKGLWVNRYPVKPSDYRQGKNASDLSFSNEIIPIDKINKCYSKPSASPITGSTGGTTSGSIGGSTSGNSSSAICANFVKKTCSQMTSCEEARQQLACGNTSLDGNKDGTPCDSLCKK